MHIIVLAVIAVVIILYLWNNIVSPIIPYIIAVLILSTIFMIVRGALKSNKNRNGNDNANDHILFRNQSLNNEIKENNTKNKKISASNYQVIHRNDTQYNNMNYNLYTVRGKNVSTNRMKTLKGISAFNIEDAKNTALEKGLSEPFEIIQEDFTRPTDEQISYLTDVYGTIPTDACKDDIAALLSMVLSKDSVPNPELIQYATEKKVKFSHYIGKRELYNVIWHNLYGTDKIAFFIFCIYRFMSNDREANLQKSKFKEAFYEFACDNIDNESFTKSMNRYEGKELRFFGNVTINDEILTGASKNTIAYKTAIEFLKCNNII